MGARGRSYYTFLAMATPISLLPGTAASAAASGRPLVGGSQRTAVYKNDPPRRRASAL